MGYSMCDVSGISESDFDVDYLFSKKESAQVEMNGRKYLVSQQDHTAIFHITQQKPELHSLQGRSITHAPLKEMKIGGSVQAEFEIEWGNGKEVTYTGGAKAEVRDEKNNYSKVEVWRDSSGKNGVKGSAGCKVEEK